MQKYLCFNIFNLYPIFWFGELLLRAFFVFLDNPPFFSYSSLKSMRFQLIFIKESCKKPLFPTVRGYSHPLFWIFKLKKTAMEDSKPPFSYS